MHWSDLLDSKLNPRGAVTNFWNSLVLEYGEDCGWICSPRFFSPFLKTGTWAPGFWHIFCSCDFSRLLAVTNTYFQYWECNNCWVRSLETVYLERCHIRNILKTELILLLHSNIRGPQISSFSSSNLLHPAVLLIWISGNSTSFIQAQTLRPILIHSSHILYPVGKFRWLCIQTISSIQHLSIPTATCISHPIRSLLYNPSPKGLISIQQPKGSWHWFPSSLGVQSQTPYRAQHLELPCFSLTCSPSV